MIVNDYEASGQTTTWGRSQNIKAQVAVPLLVEGKPLGTLAVLSFTGHAYEASDADFLSLLAAIVAPALEASRLAREVGRHKDLAAQVYDALAVGVIVYDRAGRPVHYNRAAQQAWSNALGDPSGVRDHTYPIYDGDGAPVATAERPFARALKERSAVRGLVAGYDVGPDRRWAYVDAVPIFDAAGEADSVITSSIDITQLRNAEARRREDAARLRNLIAVQGELGSPDANVDHILQLVADSAAALTGAPGAAVQLLDGDEVIIAACAGFGSELKDKRFPAAGNPIRSCINGSRSELTGDTLIDPRCNQEVARLTGIRSLVMAPIRHEGRVIGGLQVQSAASGAFDAATESTVELLAGFAGAAVSRARAASAHRAVIESAPDPIVLFNGDGEIVDFNPAAEKAFLRGRDEVVGRVATVLIADKHLEAFHQWSKLNKQANSAEHAGRVFETNGRRSDGTEFPMQVVITDLPGKTLLAAAFLRDLTLRDHLKESRERLASVVSSAPIIVIGCDPAGVITLAEGSGLSVTGLALGDAVGRNLRTLISWKPESLSLIDRMLNGSSETGRLRVENPDLYLGAAASPMLDRDGVVTGFSVVLSDATARVRAEEARRDSEAKSRLMAMMNHEVRTPLNSILGFAHLLKDSELGPLTEKQQRYVSNIETSGRHLLELVNEALDLARLDIGRVPIELAPFSVQDALDQAADQMRPLAGANGVALDVDRSAELFVVADRRQLMQVLLNLLSNAVRHTQAGGSVTIAARREQSQVLVSVADTGDGISKDDQARLFEEFYQAGNHAPGGAGLGLAISRRLVQLIGGTIEVESELGRGSTFTVRLRAG